MYHQQLCNQITFSFLNVETNNKGILLFIFISDHVQYGFNIFSPENRHMNLTDLSVINCTVYTWFDQDCCKLIQRQTMDFLCG